MPQRRILIIDSNLPFLMRLRKALEKQMDVRAISRPRPALTELAQGRFDAAVVDLNMEWVEIHRFISDMRARQADLPIVLTGQYNDDPDRMSKLPVQGYLHKPYLAKDLLPILEQAIQRGYQPEAPKTSAAEFKEVPSFDRLMEIALKQSTQTMSPVSAEEAPATDVNDDSTIGQLLSSLYDPGVEAEILHKVSERRGEEVKGVDVLSDHIEDTRPTLVIPPDEIGDEPISVEITDERAEAFEREIQNQQNVLNNAIADEIIAEPVAEDTASLPITTALRLTNNDLAMHKFLETVDEWVNRTGKIRVRPLPSWANPPTPEEETYQHQLLAAIKLAPVDGLSSEFEEPPHTEQTQPITIPDIDLYLDETDTPIVPMPAMYYEAHPIDVSQIVSDFVQEVQDIPMPVDYTPLEQEFEAVSLEEVTQALSIIYNEDASATALPSQPPTEEVFVQIQSASNMPPHPAFSNVERTPDDEAVEEFLEELHVIGHATLQLIGLSVESTARAILLTYDDRVVARTGDLPRRTWEDITFALLDAWRRPGAHDTRLVYRDVDTLGNILIYSLQTIHDLLLTLVFPADTHMGIIRRQAHLIRDAMNTIPEQKAESDTLPLEPIAPAMIEEESEAAITLPNRPTDLRPPDGLREAVVENGETSGIEPVVIEPPVVVRPPRAPGMYMEYACLWLLDLAGVNLNKPFGEAINKWLTRTAEENDWDLKEVEIGEYWVNVHIAIPTKMFIGDVVDELMAQTNVRLLEALGLHANSEQSIWAEGYSVITPGRLFERDEIAQFVEFYKDTLLM